MNESREHIIKKATILFLQKSFKAVTMKEIVSETGMSKGAFYHYFPSKESLFLEVVETYFKMLAINFGSLDNQSLRHFYTDYIKTAYKKFLQLKEFLDDKNDEDDLTYLSLTMDAMNLFPGFSEKIRVAHEDELATWERVVKSAIERGEIKTVMQPMLVAKLFIYISDGVGQRLIMQGQHMKLQDELLYLWDGIYNELKV